MSFRAKVAAAFLVILSILSGWYFIRLALDVSTTPVSEIDYEASLVALIVGIVIAMIVAMVVIAIRAARRLEPIDEEDERDRLIDMRGDQVSTYVLVAGIVLGIGLAMLQVDYLWIANGLLAALLAAGITRSAVVLYAHLRGI